MTLANLGITKADFEDSAFEDLARELTWIPRTKTVSNVTGSPTYTDNTEATISGILTKRSMNYDWAKEGFIEQGNAFLQVKEDVDICKDDYIKTTDEKYRVEEVLLREPQGIRFFKSCVLFKMEDN
jgi:hypothetical protein